VDLFCEAWPAIANGTVPRVRQLAGGTAHNVRDVEALDRIDIGRKLCCRELINICGEDVLAYRVPTLSTTGDGSTFDCNYSQRRICE